MNISFIGIRKESVNNFSILKYTYCNTNTICYIRYRLRKGLLKHMTSYYNTSVSSCNITRLSCGNNSNVSLSVIQSPTTEKSVSQIECVIWYVDNV